MCTGMARTWRATTEVKNTKTQQRVAPRIPTVCAQTPTTERTHDHECVGDDGLSTEKDPKHQRGAVGGWVGWGSEREQSRGIGNHHPEKDSERISAYPPPSCCVGGMCAPLQSIVTFVSERTPKKPTLSTNTNIWIHTHFNPGTFTAVNRSSTPPHHVIPAQ